MILKPFVLYIRFYRDRYHGDITTYNPRRNEPENHVTIYSLMEDDRDEVNDI